MKVKMVFLILFVVLSFSNCVADVLGDYDYEILKLNRYIFDYYNQLNSADTLNYFRADFPYLLTNGRNKVFLFNSEHQEGYNKINDKQLNTYQPLRFILKKNLSPFSDINYSEENLLYIHLDYDYFNLNDMTIEDRLGVLRYVVYRLYDKHLQILKKDMISLPDYEYPVLDEVNRVLSLYEYNLLTQALINLRNEKRDDALTNLSYFYAIRLNRWKNQNSFIQAYELSQEKKSGLAFYEYYKILNYLIEDKQINVSLIDIFHNKIFSVYEDNLIAVNDMSKNKSENKGFLLAMIYDMLDWDYSIENSKIDFHQFLGEKLNLRNTQVDSLFKDIYQSTDYHYLVDIAGKSKERYLRNYEEKKKDYDFKIIFDHYTENYYNPKEEYYINSQERSILYPFSNKYKIQSQWLSIELKKTGFLHYIDRKSKNLQTVLSADTKVLLDDVIYDFSKTSNQPVSFDKFELISANLNITANTPGEIYRENGQLVIKVIPRLRFYIEEEYWEKIEELNRVLISRGVPENWLADNINHEKFKIYHSVSRHFTSMPEHRVSRGERSQDWYMRHFGVDAKIRRGADFRKQHIKTLQAAEKRHGIHYELLMAIMAIESDYANPRWRGNFYTFGTLVSQYLLIPRRQRFATNELVALYRFSDKTEKDVYHFIGSFAGAAGWGQFIPTSMNAYFINANDNFREVDIFSVEDTIHSISNYLNKHGLSGRNISNEKALYNAVFAYNHSDAYVQAVLHIYRELYKQRNK